MKRILTVFLTLLLLCCSSLSFNLVIAEEETTDSSASYEDVQEPFGDAASESDETENES